jgi:hypothetical protein
MTGPVEQYIKEQITKRNRVGLNDEEFEIFVKHLNKYSDDGGPI